MNKKLFAVLSTAGIAATFWACGSGEIYEPDTVDDVVKSIVDNGGAASLCLDAKDLCTPASEVSSSSEAISSAAKPKSSSSRVAPTFESSSSGPSIIPTLSSSSTTPVDPTAIGTCTPNPTTIKRDGGSASFKFVANAGANIPIAGTKYEWDFGSTATPSTFTGMTPSGVTFSKSGSVIAKVNVTYGGLTKTVACSPLQVNGADITGCKCAPTASEVDIATDGSATWNVTGCSSVGANIIGYAWSGATGEGATASKTFTEKVAAFSPTVVVSNDDNTKVEVVCDPVKAADSEHPDYMLTFENSAATNNQVVYGNGEKTSSQPSEVAVVVTKSGGCVTVNGSWTNEFYSPASSSVVCELVNASGACTLDMTSTGMTPVSEKGENSARGQIKLPTPKNIKTLEVCVEYTGATGAKCQLQF